MHHMVDPKLLSENLLHDLTAVRHKKVDSIKCKLASGSYHPKSSSVAKALVGFAGRHHKH